MMPSSDRIWIILARLICRPPPLGAAFKVLEVVQAAKGGKHRRVLPICELFEPQQLPASQDIPKGKMVAFIYW